MKTIYEYNYYHYHKSLSKIDNMSNFRVEEIEDRDLF